jgi:hypothetical protein
VSHFGLAIYIKKYLKAKEELWKFKYFTMQKYNLQKKKNTKISSFKNPHIKIDLLPRCQKTLKLLYFVMNVNTISLPW